jgi:asparagine synthase (glutamine-hydrolysing)
MPGLARKLLAAVAERMPYAGYGKNYLRVISRPSPVERYFELQFQPYELRRRLLHSGWAIEPNLKFIQSTYGQYLPDADGDVLTQVMYFEAKANLTGDILVKVDRMSMANSLEVRSPLLDVRLAELAATIPHRWKMSNGKGKQILIKAIGDRLPPELLRLPKKGFGMPLRAWFRGPLRELIWDHLTSDAFLNAGIVSRSFMRTVLEEHYRGRRDNYHALWVLLMLEMWLRGQRTGGTC